MSYSTLLRLCRLIATRFLAYIRLKAKRDSSIVLVKSALTGVETEGRFIVKFRLSAKLMYCTVPRNDLIPWLEHQLAEQRKAEAIEGTAPTPSVESGSRDTQRDSIHVLVPGEGHRKQRKQSKNIFLEKGECSWSHISSRMLTGCVYSPRIAKHCATGVLHWYPGSCCGRTTFGFQCNDFGNSVVIGR